MRIKFTCNVWFIIAIALLFLYVRQINAQDFNATPEPPIVFTVFASSCIETLSPIHYRLHFGYVSNGEETFDTSFGNANNDTAYVNIPTTFITETGQHELGYLDAHSVDSAYDFTVTFTGTNGSTMLHLNTWQVTTPCEVSSVLPDATPEPTPNPVTDGCPAWSLESATGNSICLWDLPRYEAHK